ncbi:zinc-binding alcohol dehydrogenase family protein [Sphingobium sp. EP60837]|uniref:zinc-binding alcohol dehydrogenase family protein n=1 Tax=Sphingobium sp. EP60837 TaxID=1855519 RepID=UPI0007DDEBE4|nr:zinc-binding alcohol dehydrogenase family protein [Sphingobium sp. EP60837]ANI79167.1 Alcohol dehydrogenase [Sphingobium sp. EP60837]
MRAIGFTESGSIDRDDALLDIEVPDPVAGPRDLLVRVHAVSVNPVDIKVRAAAKPRGGQPMILGFDAAGIVEAVGPEVTLFTPGDEVYYAGTIVRPGTNAELHAVDERIVGRKPSSLGWAASAALPLTALTAWEILFDCLRVSRHKDAGRSILIVNGAGGVGSMLVQLARQLTNLQVIATASRPDTVQWAEGLGAHHVIDHHRPLDEELARIGVRCVDYVASLAASDNNLAQIAKIIAPRGALCLIDDVRAFDIVPLRQKSITVAWEGVFTRSIYKTDDMIEQHNILNEIARLVDEGVLRSTLTKELGPIDAAHLKAAHRLVETGQMIGKVALAGFPSLS